MRGSQGTSGPAERPAPSDPRACRAPGAGGSAAGRPVAASGRLPEVGPRPRRSGLGGSSAKRAVPEALGRRPHPGDLYGRWKGSQRPGGRCPWPGVPPSHGGDKGALPRLGRRRPRGRPAGRLRGLPAFMAAVFEREVDGSGALSRPPPSLGSWDCEAGPAAGLGGRSGRAATERGRNRAGCRAAAGREAPASAHLDPEATARSSRRRCRAF